MCLNAATGIRQKWLFYSALHHYAPGKEELQVKNNYIANKPFVMQVTF